MNDEKSPAIASIENGVAAFFEEHPELALRGIVVAYSGGADSSVLLDALASRGISRLRAVHVVHNLRDQEELRRERLLVKDNCRKLGLPLTVAVIKAGAVEHLACEKRLGLEAAARELRYGILRREARRFGLGAICTAHTADDQLETMIARFLSSSSVDGLAGIPPLRRIAENLSIARPLLFASRKEVERYAEEKGLAYSTDSSNASTEFFRNRIRQSLMPVLEREFPGWRRGVSGTREKLGRDKIEIGKILEKAMSNCRIDRSLKEARVPFDVFLESSMTIRVRILAACMDTVSGEERLSYRALLNAAESLAAGAKKVDVLDARISKADGWLSILSILDFKREDGYFFQVESEGSYRAGDLVVAARWAATKGKRPPPERAPGTGEGCLFEESFEFPLIVRSRKPGDAIRTEKGIVRLDDILKDWHIDRKYRNKVPVIEDAKGIIAILPSALSGAHLKKEKFRLYEGPKAGRKLYIRIKGA